MGKVSTTGASAPVGGKNRRQLIMAIVVALVVSGAMLGAVVALALLPDDAPDLVSTGDDFEAIVRSAAAYSDWLNAHPDPDLVGRIYDVSCDCYEPRRRALAELNSTARRRHPQRRSRRRRVKAVSSQSQLLLGNGD